MSVRQTILNQVMRFADPADMDVGNWDICTDNILSALVAAGFSIERSEKVLQLLQERDRLMSALERCQAIGCSQVKEIAHRAISSLPISDCSCKIEMGSFRFRGSHCILCGGVIG